MTTTADKPTIADCSKHFKAMLDAGCTFSVASGDREPDTDITESVRKLVSEADRLKAENKRIQGKLTAWERSADATSGRSR